MEQNHYNLKKLVRIEVKDFRELRNPTYKEKTTFLGVTIQSEGWYGYLNKVEQPIEEHLKQCGYDLDKLVIKEKEVLEKPYVLLHFQDKHRRIQHFETLQDAQDFAENIKNLANTSWITD